jgi:hypothetical protein
MGKVNVGGDVIGGSAVGAADLFSSGAIFAGGRLASITIGGSLIAGTDNTSGLFLHNGAIQALDDIGAITIKGSIIGNSTNRFLMTAGGQAVPTASTDLAIGKLKVTGRVEFANILAGYDVNDSPINGNAQIGNVTIGGDWIASNLVAGVQPDAFGQFGLYDFLIPGGTGLSKIGKIVISGRALGTIDLLDHYGFVARQIVSFKVGKTTFPLQAGAANDIAGFTVGATGDLVVKEVAA